MCKTHIERIATQWQMNRAVKKERKNNNNKECTEMETMVVVWVRHHWSGEPSNAIIFSLFFFFFHSFILLLLDIYSFAFFFFFFGSATSYSFRRFCPEKASLSASVVPWSHFRLLSFAREKKRKKLRFVIQTKCFTVDGGVLSSFFQCKSTIHILRLTHMSRYILYVWRYDVCYVSAYLSLDFPNDVSVFNKNQKKKGKSESFTCESIEKLHGASDIASISGK